MSDARETVIIGDCNKERADVLYEILEKKFNRRALIVNHFALVRAKVEERKNEAREKKTDLEKQNCAWKLILIANDLPLQSYESESVMPHHVQSLTVLDANIRFGCIYSTTKPGWEIVDKLQYLPVLNNPLSKRERRDLVGLLEQAGRWTRELPVPAIHLVNDPVLREQVRALDRNRDLESGKKILSYLIRNLQIASGEESVEVARLGQGRSGAQVFRLAPAGMNSDKPNYVIKLSPREDQWKLHYELDGHKSPTVDG